MPGQTRITRRRFLGSLAAATAAAPYVITRPAWGQGRTGPNDRIVMGCIGIGNQGGGLLGGFLGHPDVQVAAICDVKKGVRDQSKQRVESQYGQAMRDGQYAGCDLYDDFRELLARDDIDAVQVSTPDHWHAVIAVAACRAGKDVYCEKPLSLTVREARAMVTAARRYGRVFQTGSQQRSSGNFRQACELVRSGRIGTVQTVHVGVGGPSTPKVFPAQPVPDGLDWDRWLGPAPWRPYNAEACSGDFSGGWRLVRDFSGGMMTDWGAHHFDIAQWGLGMDDSGPVEIHAPDGKDYSTLTYRYANGVTMYHGQANGVLFTGTDGRIEVNRGYLRSWPDSILEQPIGPDDVHLYESPGHQADFIHCVRTRRRPICDVEIGCRSATVCHLGNIAYWLNRSLRWDPQAEQILGDDEAARWLDRPKRAPWRV